MGASDQVWFVFPWDCAHLSSKPHGQFGIDVRTAGLFDEPFLLRARQVMTRVWSHGSGAGTRLSSLFEENTFIIANLSAAPTYKEVREADQSYTLIPVQRVNTPLQNKGFMSIVTFFYAGSNISIVQTGWAERAGLKGLPISRQVHVAGGHSKEWKTKLYQVPILKNDGRLVRVLALGMETTRVSKVAYFVLYGSG